MELTYDDKIKIIMNELVVKDAHMNEKDKRALVLSWLQFSDHSVSKDEAFIKNEPIEHQHTLVTILDIMAKLFAFASIFITTYTYYYEPLFITSRFDIFTLHIVLLPIHILTIVIIFIGAFPMLKILSRYSYKQHLIKQGSQTVTVTAGNITNTYYSKNIKSSTDALLQTINFEQSINNFRKLNRDSGISVRLATINNVDAALCKI